MKKVLLLLLLIGLISVAACNKTTQQTSADTTADTSSQTTESVSETNDIISADNSETFSIETKAGIELKYPVKWKDTVDVNVTQLGVQFSNNGTPLFDIAFADCDGYLLGTYNGTPVYIVEYEIQNEEQAAMQEDVNVILDNLRADPNFAGNTN